MLTAMLILTRVLEHNEMKGPPLLFIANLCISGVQISTHNIYTTLHQISVRTLYPSSTCQISSWYQLKPFNQQSLPRKWRSVMCRPGAGGGGPLRGQRQRERRPGGHRAHHQGRPRAHLRIQDRQHSQGESSFWGKLNNNFRFVFSKIFFF